MPQRIESIDVSVEELHQLIDSAGERPLSSEGQRKLKAGVNTLGALAALLEEKDTTLQQLRELLLPVRTSEKTAKVLGKAGGEEPQRKRERKKGHGRKSAAAYAGAAKVRVAHPVLKRADRCPECQKGKVYPLQKPNRICTRAPYVGHWQSCCNWPRRKLHAASRSAGTLGSARALISIVQVSLPSKSHAMSPMSHK